MQSVEGLSQCRVYRGVVSMQSVEGGCLNAECRGVLSMQSVEGFSQCRV